MGRLLDADLRIPPYQRPYTWSVETAMRLYDDIVQARRENVDGVAPYVLGAVIVHRHENGLDIVDGQQRLLTLRLLTSLLGFGAPLRLDASSDSAVARVFRALESRTRFLLPENASGLCDFILNRCEVVQVVTNDADEAFRVFDSQNYRGKQLAPHDLLKAYHLREMSDDTDAMKRAVVDAWESATDDDLDRLFALYLYRILKWSRAERAHVFTTHDIDVFKGLSPRAESTPSARYHLAAQAAIPMLHTWSSPGREEQRDYGRARFQLDAPLMAGRPFFEMTTFMLSELKALRAEAYEPDWEPFCSSEPETLQEIPARSRYRKVSELYLAALLYFTNKFGDELGPEAKQTLFAWAYSARVELQRVQHASIDKRASGEEGPGVFAWVRRSQTPTEVIRHTRVEIVSRPGHEQTLVNILNGGIGGG